MKRTIAVAGFAVVVLAGAYAGFAGRADAGGCGGGGGGCGPGAGAEFCCGAGEKMSAVAWNDEIPTPGTAKTGEAVAPTIDELKAGKPLLVYYYVEGLKDAAEDSFKLSKSFEESALANEKVKDALRTDWRAKKVALDVQADRKKAENQARLEFWSFTGTKLGDVAAKFENQAEGKPLASKLASLATKDKDLRAKEIKKLEDAARKQAAK